MHDIVIPKLNNNDTEYLLLEWLFEDGQQVPVNSPVALIETSKAIEELETEEGGLLHRMAEEGKEYGVGEVIGRVVSGQDELDQSRAAIAEPASSPLVRDITTADAGILLTRSARELADLHGVDIMDLRRLNRRIVKRIHVEQLLAGRETEREELPGYRFGRNQLAVARAVSQSHRLIPTAFAAVKVQAAAALAFQKRLTEQTGLPVGRAELLIKAVAEQVEHFPLMFARLRADDTAELATEAHVGVTLDVGRGLYVPVVRNARGQSPTRVAETLMDYRVKALRQEFGEEDLSGGNIMVSLSDEPDVVLARPVVFPGQTCAVSLCAVQTELCLDASGEVAERRYFHLGVCYDHRVVNGREAVAFLRAVKQLCESPDTLLEGDSTSPEPEHTGVEVSHADRRRS
ncbi:2-oxo acid dehydrogenase subunit E2 [Streptomyces sp. NPDC050287]|uniref:2-oxo acid dehydrogenase subunit E2 n=1 Tax=Streptomyces sp. NPDC050287 TaxID=3365608 RepID=UPI0037A28D67